MRAHELAERELEEAEHPPVRDRLLLDAVAALEGDRLVHEPAAVLFAPADRRDQRPNGQHLRKAPRVTAVEEDLRRLLDVAFGRIQVAGAPSTSASLSSTNARLFSPCRVAGSSSCSSKSRAARRSPLQVWSAPSTEREEPAADSGGSASSATARAIVSA